MIKHVEPILKKFSAALLVTILLAGLSACAVNPARTAGFKTDRAGQTAENGKQYWWFCRFKITWPAGTPVDMTADLMLAHAVVEPVLDRFRSKIRFWRFHRRAARDGAGHQFNFIFYTDPGTAAAIMADLKKSAVLRQALSENIVEKINFDNPDIPRRPNPEDTSDKNWPVEIQKNWPAYIMGVSATWLGLIDELMSGMPAVADMHKLFDQYRQVDARITSMWSRNGQHAFIHHLSAIFGYEPLIINEEIRF